MWNTILREIHRTQYAHLKRTDNKVTPSTLCRAAKIPRKIWQSWEGNYAGHEPELARFLQIGEDTLLLLALDKVEPLEALGLLHEQIEELQATVAVLSKRPTLTARSQIVMYVTALRDSPRRGPLLVPKILELLK